MAATLFVFEASGERRPRRSSPNILIAFSDEGTFAVVEVNHRLCPPVKEA